MSEDAHDAITAFPQFITESRGIISVKVKYERVLKLRFVLHIVIL